MLTTNSHIRRLVPWHDLPAKAQEEFGYLEHDQKHDERFVKYRGLWLDVMDAQVINDRRPFGFPVSPVHALYGWDAIATDSFFSGTVFRFPNDDEVFRHDLYSERYEYIIVGRWTE